IDRAMVWCLTLFATMILPLHLRRMASRHTIDPFMDTIEQEMNTLKIIHPCLKEMSFSVVNVYEPYMYWDIFSIWAEHIQLSVWISIFGARNLSIPSSTELARWIKTTLACR